MDEECPSFSLSFNSGFFPMFSKKKRIDKYLQASIESCNVTNVIIIRGSFPLDKHSWHDIIGTAEMLDSQKCGSDFKTASLLSCTPRSIFSIAAISDYNPKFPTCNSYRNVCRYILLMRFCVGPPENAAHCHSATSTMKQGAPVDQSRLATLTWLPTWHPLLGCLCLKFRDVQPD